MPPDLAPLGAHDGYPSAGLSPEHPSHDGSKPAPAASPRPPLPVEEDVMQLSRLGEMAAIQKLFESGKADANAKDEQGVTPLHWAAYKNHYALCHFLIQYGADVNAKGGDLRATPILWAARNCHYYVVNLLLQHGADPLRTDDQGFNLLQNATLDGNVFQLLLLLYQDVPVDTPDGTGHTSLMWAAYKGFPACVEVLLRWGASVSATDEQGFTALHWGLVKGSYPCIQKLVEYGSDRSRATLDGKTPPTVAREMNTVPQWERALAENGYNADGSPRLFPLSSIVKDTRLFITRFCFLWPFIIIPCDIYILSGMPIYAGVPIAAIFFFVMQWVVQKLLQWAPPDMRRIDHTPFLAGIFAGTFFWVLVQYVFRILPRTFGQSPVLNILFIIVAGLCTIFYSRAIIDDPGYIPKGGSRHEQKDIVLDLISNELFDERHFCVTCMIRKPQRSKHCRRCGRCVAKHDHHCPWVNNCVAVNTHRHFVLYILTMAIGILLAVRLTFTYISTLPTPSLTTCNILRDDFCMLLNRDPFTIVLMIWTALQLTWVLMLIFVQLIQISRATTTYENMRGHVQLSGTSAAVTSAITSGTTSLEDAGLTERGSGPDPVGARADDRAKRGCLAQWKRLFGVDVFMATAMKETRGAGQRANRHRNPFTRGMLTNCKDFFCDAAPLFGRRRNGEAMLGGHKVDYTSMYDVPPRSNMSYTAVSTDDSV